MLRHVSLLAGLIIVATCLVAAAEPETPKSSGWVPAGQVRESTYRASDGEPAILPIAQPGTPNLADRLKAARNPAASDTNSEAASQRTPTAPPEAAAPIATGPAEQLPSVLVRRGAGEPATIPAAPSSEADTEAAAPVTESPAEPAPADAPAPEDLRGARLDGRSGTRMPCDLPPPQPPSARSRPAHRSWHCPAKGRC